MTLMTMIVTLMTREKAPESTLGSKFRVERSKEGEGSRTQDKSQADQTELCDNMFESLMIH